MNQAPILVWFRRDLRLADNAALLSAVQRAAPVIPVFVWSQEEEAPWQPGAASRWWLHHSVERLRDSLGGLGSMLVIRTGPALETLIRLAEECGAKTVVWNRLYEPATVARDRGVKRGLRDRGFAAESFASNFLFEPRSILNAKGEPFRVFTAFSKACVQAPAPAVPMPAPARMIAPAAWPGSVELAKLRLLPEIDWTEGLRESWQPGEAGAEDRVRGFLEGGVQSYATERDRPDHAGTSRLSPHLHFGEISPRQIWHAQLWHSARAGGKAFMRQLLWREFARHLLFHFPHTAEQPLRPEFARFPWRMNGKKFRAWTEGRTGYPLVDAGMRELWRTGWMHNRLRMVTASFLVKHLLIPWQEGAAWFWDTLVDADSASNTLGWQWAAGCGADAAPYFRIFNPALQAAKFDPEGEYVRRWAPESAAPIVEHAAARARALAAFQKMREERS